MEWVVEAMPFNVDTLEPIARSVQMQMVMAYPPRTSTDQTNMQTVTFHSLNNYVLRVPDPLHSVMLLVMKRPVIEAHTSKTITGTNFPVVFN